jgi:hypothetical protein
MKELLFFPPLVKTTKTLNAMFWFAFSTKYNNSGIIPNL